MTAEAPHAYPSRTPRRRGSIRAQVVAALAITSLLLTGCAAGQRAQTAVAIPVLDGVSATVGQINLRAITIASPASGSYAKGATAAVQLFIVNTGVPDELSSVSSPAAASASIYPNATAAFSATPAPSSSSSSAPAAAAGPTIKLASGETTVVGQQASQPQIMLAGLANALFPAMSVPITFTFANAGAVTVWVSVHLSTGPVVAPTLPITHDTLEP